MAKYGAANTKIEFDLVGGTPQDMSTYITEINGIDIEAITEDSTPFGSAWQQALATGNFKMADVELGGYYDDAATTGPDVVFNVLAVGPAAVTRTLKVTYGSTKCTSVEVLIVKYTRLPARNGITKFKVLLRPTGAVTEA